MYSYNRYSDKSKFIADESRIEFYEDCYIRISDEDDYDMEIVLTKGARDIADIKKYIISLIGYICELDNMAQKYLSIQHPALDQFPYDLANIYIDGPEDIRLGYYGIIENTEFDVGFKFVENRFVLRSYGMTKDIPEDWDK